MAHEARKAVVTIYCPHCDGSGIEPDSEIGEVCHWCEGCRMMFRRVVRSVECQPDKDDAVA